MTLVILHYHLRPGGIRRVIELASPHLVRLSNLRIQKIIVASGEPPDPRWQSLFKQRIAPVPVQFFEEKTFGYLSEQRGKPQRIIQRIRGGIDHLLEACATERIIVWMHNPGIARNLLLTREIVEACDRRQVQIVFHHHDWWFDNRWRRWVEMRALGIRTLADAAAIVFPSSKNVTHLTINQPDARLLKRHIGPHAGWVPNLIERRPPPSLSRLQAARRWLTAHIGDPEAPIWILPCRLLRRKNVTEALLLTRWLRPEAWLITTGGVSSADEASYGERLKTATEEHGWRLRMGVLSGNQGGSPTVEELLGNSECVLLTSIQEGFGLPYLEASAADRPLIARLLPNIEPDLKRFGFRFPQGYRELMIPRTLFDWKAEVTRQRRMFAVWRQTLPRACRGLVRYPAVLSDDCGSSPVGFSRLTLTAQLEVLSKPVQESWECSKALNPHLEKWKENAARGDLAVSTWPRAADAFLSGPNYAQKWQSAIAPKRSKRPGEAAAIAIQQEFIAWKLSDDYQYPQLWAKES